MKSGLFNKRATLNLLNKRQMPGGMNGLLSSIIQACGGNNGSPGKSVNWGGMYNSGTDKFGETNITQHHSEIHLSKWAIIGIAIGGVVLLSILALLVCCLVRRRNANRRRTKAGPKFYPEVSYLYDPPPGAPSPGTPGAPMMSAQREVPDTAYTGAAGVAASHVTETEKDGLLPSAGSVLAPLRGYTRAGQDDSNDLGDREHLNPFRDQPAGEYRDSIDAPHRH